MTHSEPITRSPSSFSFTRSTPCVDGCCGPMLRISSSAPSSVSVLCVASSCTVSAKQFRLLTAFDAEIFPHPRGVLLKNVVVLAQRVPLPLIRQQNTLQPRVAKKFDPKQVEYFAFQPVRCGPDAG